MDQVVLINFQFLVSQTKFRYLKCQLKYFRITRAQIFCEQKFQFFHSVSNRVGLLELADALSIADSNTFST